MKEDFFKKKLIHNLSLWKTSVRGKPAGRGQRANPGPAPAVVHPWGAVDKCRPRPLAMPFDYTLDFATVDFRQHPELYRVGKGEQGVLLVQPYKGEILPHWRFKDAATAQESAAAIWALFEAYLSQHDFVGADMARKFLQMGYTRARRYANHAGGKYAGPVPADKKGQSGAHGRAELPRNEHPDVDKVEAAAIFKRKWDEARALPEYQAQKAAFEAQYGK
jgi:hypothetical protein